MKKINFILFGICLLLIFSCKNDTKKDDTETSKKTLLLENNDKTNPLNNKQTPSDVNTSSDFTPEFEISIRAKTSSSNLPFVQSGAWARQGSKILVLGGRIEGFHGLEAGTSTFGVKKANTSIFSIDLSNNTYKQLVLDSTDATLLQLSASNMQFVQDGNSLFIVGGYGRKTIGAPQSNWTFDRLIEINVSDMISEVEKESLGNPHNAIAGTVQSPTLQVTGGEMILYNDTFYLLYGQNFDGVYDPGGIDGTYTEAIRTFNYANEVLSNTQELKDSVFHRRDLNVMSEINNSSTRFIAYGGVFSPKGDGYLNPIVYDPAGSGQNWNIADIAQKTNNYACATISIYDAINNSNYHVILGGIGQYQYHEDSGTWENGDSGNKLPFVSSITQMKWKNGSLAQHIQIPPNESDMGSLLGANAIFIPNEDIQYSYDVIDYSKMQAGENVIGLMCGGILATAPSSNEFNPTSVNKKVYEVILTMN